MYTFLGDNLYVQQIYYFQNLGSPRMNLPNCILLSRGNCWPVFGFIIYWLCFIAFIFLNKDTSWLGLGDTIQPLRFLSSYKHLSNECSSTLLSMQYRMSVTSVHWLCPVLMANNDTLTNIFCTRVLKYFSTCIFIACQSHINIYSQSNDF